MHKIWWIIFQESY